MGGAGAGDDELRVLPGGGGAPGGAARPQDLPLPVQCWAVAFGLIPAATAGGSALGLAAAGVGGLVQGRAALADPAEAARLAAVLQGRAASAPAGLPLLLAAAEEGGRSRALPDGPASLPAAAALGAAGDPGLAREAGRSAAGRLRAVGVSANLAPVCNVAPPDGRGPGARCLSSDPDRAAAMASAWVAGLQAGGSIACPRLLADGPPPAPPPPGPGAVPPSLRVLAAVARAGAGVIVLPSPAVAARAGWPAGLVGAIALWLRRGLGFEGAILAELPPGSPAGPAAVEALLCGADAVLAAPDAAAVEAAAGALAAAASAGGLPHGRLAGAVEAVLRCKRAGGLHRLPPPDPEAAAHLLARPSDALLARRIAAAAVTLVRPGPVVASPAEIGFSRATPGALRRAATERWPGARLRHDGAGRWLSLDSGSGACHLLIGLPLPEPLPAGRVLLAHDAVPASLEALLRAAAGEAPAPGRLPG